MGPFSRLGVLLSLSATVAISAWGAVALPDVVPTHFGAGGRPDANGSRWSLLAVGLVALGVVGLFAGLSAWCGGRGSLASINVPHKQAWLPEHETELRRRLAVDLGLFAVALGVGVNALYAGSLAAALDGSGLPLWSMTLGALGLAATLGLSLWLVVGRYRPPT